MPSATKLKAYEQKPNEILFYTLYTIWEKYCLELNTTNITKGFTLWLLFSMCIPHNISDAKVKIHSNSDKCAFLDKVQGLGFNPNRNITS